MTPYYTYDASMKVIARGTCGITDIPRLTEIYLAMGQTLVEGTGLTGSCRVELLDGIPTIVDLPQAPGPYHCWDPATHSWINHSPG